jgi:hypothetical protein
MAQFKSAKVLAVVGDKHLQLYQGKGYWYFIYDDRDAAIYDTRSIMVMRLSDLSFERWLEEARDFVAYVNTKWRKK